MDDMVSNYLSCKNGYSFVPVSDELLHIMVLYSDQFFITDDVSGFTSDCSVWVGWVLSCSRRLSMCWRLILLGVGGLYYWVINDAITRNWLQISQYWPTLPSYLKDGWANQLTRDFSVTWPYHYHYHHHL